MARDCTESRFREVLDRFGGPQHVQLVAELWDRAESRILLDSFLRELFPDRAGTLSREAAEQQGGHEKASGCKPAQQPDSPKPPPAKPERTLRFGLVFFVCRPESLLQRDARRRLREILRDVRGRMAGGGAVIGVIVQPDSAARNGQQEMLEDKHEGAEAEVPSLLSLLQSVFPLQNRTKLCSEVRAALLVPGQEDTRRDIQNLACEAITAADELRKLKPKVKLWCPSWRRRRRQEYVLKGNITEHPFQEHLEEGTALNVLQYPNGDCAETVTDA